jgi:hypothetical protein
MDRLGLVLIRAIRISMSGILMGTVPPFPANLPIQIDDLTRDF